jgi:acetyl esterase/lipase
MKRQLSSVVAVTAILLACVSFGLMGSDASGATGTPATPLPASQVQVTKDVVFTDIGGTRLTMDVFAPRESAPNRPAVVLIHGGAWGTGNAHDLSTEGKLIARQGWVAFSINYRLADQTSTPWPDELTDVQRGVRWVGANASTYGADPQKLTVMGFSAGGHLAAMVGAIGTAIDGTGGPLSDPNPPVKVVAVAAWSPPSRLAGLVPVEGGDPPDCADNKQCAQFWRLPLVKNFLGCLPDACPDKYTQASSNTRVTAKATPTWFANATSEVTGWPQAEAYDKALTTAGVDHKFDVVQGSQHADQYRAKVWNDMMPWLAAKVGAPEPPPVSFSARNILLSPLVVISVVAGLAILITLLAIALRDDEGEL